MEGPQQLGQQSRPAREEWLHERKPCAAVGSQPARGHSRVSREQRGGTTIGRVRAGKRRLDPFESMLLQRQRGEERGGDRQGVDCRGRVVAIAGQRELVAAESPTRNG